MKNWLAFYVMQNACFIVRFDVQSDGIVMAGEIVDLEAEKSRLAESGGRLKYVFYHGAGKCPVFRERVAGINTGISP